MSKITPKNLSYDTTLPPFLARLQANNASSSGRHEYTVARPKKVRTAEDEAEDEPVYFNEESGETLTKSEWEEKEKELEPSETADGEGKGDAKVEGEEGKEKGKEERVAGIGGSRKRKAGKVVGVEEDEGAAYNKAREHVKKTSKVPEKPVEGKKVDSKAEVGPKKPAKTKGSKKIKLSFGDDE